MNRTLLFAALTTLCAALPTDEVLTWRVAKGTTLTRSFESTIHAELKSLSVSVDGEQQDTGPAVEMSIGHDFNYEFSDSIEAAQDGGPAKFLRKFTKISGTRARSLKAPEQDAHEEKIELTSEVEGKRVRFTRDGSTWSAKWDKDEEGDEKLLEGLKAEVDLRAFLPGKEVSKDDTWDVEASAFTNFLRPGGQLSRHGKDEDPAIQNQHESLLDGSIEGKSKATYRGMREESGAKVAVIGVSAELSLHANEDIDGGKGGMIATKLEITYKLEGEILWDAAGGFARSASITGTVGRVQTEQRTITTPDGDHKIEQVLNFEGEVSCKLSNE